MILAVSIAGLGLLRFYVDNCIADRQFSNWADLLIIVRITRCVLQDFRQVQL